MSTVNAVNSYSYEILHEQFHWTNLQGYIKLLLVTVNDKLKLEIEIVHDLSCHPIDLMSYSVIDRFLYVYLRWVLLYLMLNKLHEMMYIAYTYTRADKQELLEDKLKWAHAESTTHKPPYSFPVIARQHERE